MKTRGITPAFGVEVLGVKLPALSDAGFAELHALWKANGAMLVRGQQAMTDAQFEAFSKRFGELDPPPNQGVGRKNVPGFPDLYVVSNELDQSGEPVGALGYSEAVWHTDMSYLPVPPIASMLWSIRLPAWGGNTWVAGMCAAYENLPAALKERAKKLWIKHDGTRDSGGNLRKGVEDDPNPRTAKGHPHPAVIRDPGTGKPALFLGRRPRAYVMGLDSRRIRGGARRAVEARHPAEQRLRAQVAGRRRPDLEQLQHDAPPRRVRQEYDPSHASQPDQGHEHACRLLRLARSSSSAAASAACMPRKACARRRSS